MIILLYGKDTYRLSEKLEEIVREYKKKYKSGLNLKFLEEDFSFEDIKDEDKQFSMFQEKRLIVIKSALSSEKLRKDIAENYKKLISSENIFVFYQEGDLRKNDKILNLLLKEKAMVQSFDYLCEEKISLWIKKEFKKRGKNVDKEAISKLREAGKEDLWKMRNEIEKLSAYKHLKGDKITKEDVDLMVSVKAEAEIFNTIDAMAQKDTRKSLLFLYDHLEKGDNPLYLLSMIVYQFRNLIIVKDLLERKYSYSEAKNKSNLHPFVFKKTHSQVNKFSIKELKEIYENLSLIDLKTKTGQIDPVNALHIFLFSSGKRS